MDGLSCDSCINIEKAAKGKPSTAQDQKYSLRRFVY